MKQKMILFFFFFLHSSLNHARSFKDLAFSDVHTATLVREVLDEKVPDKEFEMSYFQITQDEDLHHFRPSLGQIKRLQKKELYILGPKELFPWGTELFRNKKTIILDLSQKDFYPYTGSAEELSHFWLYPEIQCSLQKKIKAILQKEGFLTKEAQCLPLEEFLKLKEKMMKYEIPPLIITHSALSPLLKSLKIDHFSLKGSGHHEEISTKHFKNLLSFLKKRPHHIWIQESNIRIPEAVFRHKKLKDHVISVNIQNSKDLLKFLNQLIEVSRK